MGKTNILKTKPFEEVLQRFHDLYFDETFDMIVAIANGGIIPAAIINQRLQLPLHLLKISLRDSSHKPIHGAPVLIAPIDFGFKDKKILLVEDRVKSGKTMEYALQLLEGAELIKTLAVNGEADYSLYNESCFKFPWIM